jgi:uncharacterized protein (DUF58 family)
MTLSATDLLDARTVARLERLRLGGGLASERRQGERLARARGRSTDFSDYRDYVAGDDIRFVDWNILARLRRPYVKVYHADQERQLGLLVDTSASMAFEGKFDRARRLAAAIGTVALAGPEPVTLIAIQPTGNPVRLARLRGRQARLRLLTALAELEPGGPTGIDDTITARLASYHGRGIVLILSDFLGAPHLGRALDQLAASGCEPWGLQILGRSEIAPDLAGDLRLVDSETDTTIDISNAAELLEFYHEQRQALMHWLGNHLCQRGGRYLDSASDAPIDQLIFDRMVRQGWLLGR